MHRTTGWGEGVGTPGESGEGVGTPGESGGGGVGGRRAGERVNKESSEFSEIERAGQVHFKG